ncbi:hypothetical protein F1559_003098 [Cyanidiococcus yangmingshanensis]|uniref:Uncharacterized protein n=1 Tax=Cyanidiococcus yangmingshanensis TaxID=2690220 RepID=A0A7J7IDK5_9RHOD|nr:hypothetical protein F1559_003098 [Cyanidiococcus yangmingshanensis]
MPTPEQERLVANLQSVRAQALDCCRQLAALRQRLLQGQARTSQLLVSESLVTHYALVLKLYGLVWASVQRLLPQGHSRLLEPASASSRIPELLRTRFDVRLERDEAELSAEGARFMAEQGWSDAALQTRIEAHSQIVRAIYEAFSETLQALQMDEQYSGRRRQALYPEHTTRVWSIADVLPTMQALDFGIEAQAPTSSPHP